MNKGFIFSPLRSKSLLSVANPLLPAICLPFLLSLPLDWAPQGSEGLPTWFRIHEIRIPSKLRGAFLKERPFAGKGALFFLLYFNYLDMHI